MTAEIIRQEEILNDNKKPIDDYTIIGTTKNGLEFRLDVLAPPDSPRLPFNSKTKIENMKIIFTTEDGIFEY